VPNKTIDLIIPCFNPQENWHLYIVDRLGEFISKIKDYSVSIILVDDGSTKGVETKHIVYLNSVFPNFLYTKLNINQGKGAALREGTRHSSSEFCMFTDIDIPYTDESMLKVISSLESPNDIVIGYRDTHYYQKIPAFRKMLSKIFRWTLRLITKNKVDDTQCGLKAFGETGKHKFMETTINRYLFDFEFIKLALRDKNLVIKKVNVELREGVTFTKMNNSIIIKELGNFILLLFK